MKIKFFSTIIFLSVISICNTQAQNIYDFLSKTKAALSEDTSKCNIKLNGSWVYEGIDINFTSKNFFAKASGEIVSAKIEKRINETLQKYGLTPSNLTITFLEDSIYTCKFKANSKNVTRGKFSFKDNNLIFTPLLTNKEIRTIAKVGESLQIMSKADKLLTLIQGLSTSRPESSVATNISKIAKKYNGMEIGLKFKAKKEEESKEEQSPTNTEK